MVYHVFVFKSIPVIVPFADNEQDSFSDDSADHDEEIVVTILLLLQCSIQYVFFFFNAAQTIIRYASGLNDCEESCEGMFRNQYGIFFIVGSKEDMHALLLFLSPYYKKTCYF